MAAQSLHLRTTNNTIPTAENRQLLASPAGKSCIQSKSYQNNSKRHRKAITKIFSFTLLVSRLNIKYEIKQPSKKACDFPINKVNVKH